MAVRKPKTYIVPGFHSDVIWLEDQRDYAKVLVRDLEQNVLAARLDPDYGFFIHELSYVKPFMDANPMMREELKRLVAAGRVGTGGSHSQAAENLIGGEALVRNIVYGRLYHERILGDRPEVFMTWDVFGHCSQLAQICAKSRFIGAIWSKAIKGARAVFWHQALDGTKLLFKRTNYTFSGMGIRKFEDFHPRITAAFAEIKALGLGTDIRMDCLDFKPPTDWFVGRAGGLSLPDHEIKVCGTGHELWFRESLEEIRRKRLRISVTARDFEFYHQGTGVSRIELKLANRLAESLLASAEKFASVAWLHGADYPDAALDKAWRQVLLAQHHDVITGASCDRGYVDVMAAYREACELAHEVYDGAVRALAGMADTETGAPSNSAIAVLIFNPLNWRRTDVVRAELDFAQRRWRGFRVVDAAGREVPCELEGVSKDELGRVRCAEVTFLAADVPSLGYATFYAVRAAKLPARRRKASGETIQNEFFSVTADPKLGGGLSSIFDKEAGRELVNLEAGPANELVALEEDPNIAEPSWEVWTKGPKHFSRDFQGAVEVWKGPVSERVVVKGEFKDCARVQEVVLCRGIRRIDFVTKLERYTGINHLHVVTFPVKQKGLQPIFEDRFGATVKRPSKGKLDFRTKQPNNHSDCGARRGNQWVALSSSAKLRFGERSAYSLGMVNIVHSSDDATIKAAEVLQGALMKLGVPVDPWQDDLEWAVRKNFKFTTWTLPSPEDFYADLPYGTSFRVSLDVAGKNAYTKRLLKQLPSKVRARFARTLKRNGLALLFMTDKETPPGWQALPVLLISASDEKQILEAAADLAKQFSKSGEARLLAEADVSELNGEVDDYSFAILNLGHVMASVENDSTMVLFLMHTARWGISPAGKDRLPFYLLPERRTHVYSYSFYGHPGDWRDGQTYLRSREFNNPLKAVCETLHAGPLKGEVEFVSSDIPGFVLTAMKPHGHATAGFDPDALDRANGITIRGYEASGRPASGSISFWRPVRFAKRANLLEEAEGKAQTRGKSSVRLSLGPFQIETLQVGLSEPRRALSGRTLGREREPIDVIHFKHWEHNLGAEPMGYGALAISLHGNVSLQSPVSQGGVTVNELSVALANNYVNREAKGEVEFLVPGGWRTHPEALHYELTPGEAKVYKVLIITPMAGVPRSGLIKARVRDGGQIFQDVMEVGNVLPLRWEVSNSLSEIKVRIENDWVQPVEGEVHVISPVETWGRELVGGQWVMGLGPLRRYFEVPAGGRGELAFPIDPPPATAGAGRHFMMRNVWAVAKLAYNGKVDYKAVPRTSAPADAAKMHV